MARLRFGSKIKYRNNLYFVVSVGKRVVRARKIFDINPKYNPHGSVSNTIYSIPRKALK